MCGRSGRGGRPESMLARPSRPQQSPAMSDRRGGNREQNSQDNDWNPEQEEARNHEKYDTCDQAKGHQTEHDCCRSQLRDSESSHAIMLVDAHPRRRRLAAETLIKPRGDDLWLRMGRPIVHVRVMWVVRRQKAMHEILAAIGQRPAKLVAGWIMNSLTFCLRAIRIGERPPRFRIRPINRMCFEIPDAWLSPAWDPRKTRPRAAVGLQQPQAKSSPLHNASHIVATSRAGPRTRP
jgi:hypothetical protein